MPLRLSPVTRQAYAGSDTARDGGVGPARLYNS